MLKATPPDIYIYIYIYIYSLVLLAYASLAASRTLLKRLLACLNFTLDSENSFCRCKQKSDFYELWQHKPDEGQTHQFQPDPTGKIH